MLTAFWYAELDAPAVPAGENLHLEKTFADLGPLAHQRRPPTTDAADSKMLDAKGLQRTATSRQTSVCCSVAIPHLKTDVPLVNCRWSSAMAEATDVMSLAGPIVIRR